MTPSRTYTVAIIGSGVSGIGAAVLLSKKLKDRGLAGVVTYTIYEKGPELGGTWHYNAYPGAACDVPSHFYSFSFALNADWSRKYSPQAEIQSYLRGVADSFGVAPHIVYNTAATHAVWQPEMSQYKITLVDAVTGNSRTTYANFVIAGAGALCTPDTPAIPGRDLYKGTTWHTARWNHGVDLKGLDVGIIGTGASAAQVVPAIAPLVKSLVVYQRTPAWIMPRLDFAYPSWMKLIFRYIPFAMLLYRTFLASSMEARFYLFIQPLAAWLKKLPLMLATKHRKTQIPDAVEAARPGLRAALTPNYQLACKRVLMSDDYYPAFTRDNVKLVTSSFRMVADGIECAAPAVGDKSGATAHKHDVIIYATGFDVTASIENVEIVGEGGLSLRSFYNGLGGPEAYWGITVPRFPNYFMCMGPNTGLGHASMIYMIECQANYAASLICDTVAAGKASVTVQQQPFTAWNADVQKRLSTAVWATCASWYNLQGKKNVSLWPGTITEYYLGTRTPNKAHYVWQ